MRVYRAVTDVLQSVALARALREARTHSHPPVLSRVLTDEICSWVLGDLVSDPGWQEEWWVLTEKESVQSVDAETFNRAVAARRFSWNECLRKPKADSWCLRGFLAAIVDKPNAAGLSAQYGEIVEFRSADIARYRMGNWLQRHCDDFEERRFGLIWFFSSTWQEGCGGELVVEAADGTLNEIPPLCGDVAVLGLGPMSFHQVRPIRTDQWQRYSIATHYGSGKGLRLR